MVAVVALLVGGVGGLLAGGQFRKLTHMRLRHEFPLVAAFLIQGLARGRLAGAPASEWAMGVWICLSLVLVTLLVLNADTPGMRVATAGVLLNLSVVLVNQGMPVSADEQSARNAIAHSAGFYELAGGGTLGSWAGDALPMHLLGEQLWLSPGDVLLMTGVGIALSRAMLRPAGCIGDRESRPMGGTAR